jgi:hypothetical protein
VTSVAAHGAASRAAGDGGEEVRVGRVFRRPEIACELVRDNREYLALLEIYGLLAGLPSCGPLSAEQNERVVVKARRAALDVLLVERRDVDRLDVALDRVEEESGPE